MSSSTPEPDEMEQSLGEDVESIENEQSTQVIPDPAVAPPSGQEVPPPVAQPEQREGTAADELGDPQQQGDLTEEEEPKEADQRFPFVINGVAEKDLWTAFFKSMARFDTRTLLSCRLVSKVWRDAIDRLTPLWSRKIDEDGNTLLHRAAAYGHTEKVQLILNCVSDKNPKNDYGDIPLHYAAWFGHLDVCRTIMDQVEKSPKNYIGETPLHYAAREGHFDICRLIVEQVVDKNPRDDGGVTPLHYAAMNGHLNICQLVINQVDDMNPASNDGVTPLELAERQGYQAVAQLIRSRLGL